MAVLWQSSAEVCLDSQVQSLRQKNLLLNVELWMSRLEGTMPLVWHLRAVSTVHESSWCWFNYIQLLILEWSFIPKLHAFAHLIDIVQHTIANSRFYHCFRNEDFMGLCKHFAVRVHKGPLFEYCILTRCLLRLDGRAAGGVIQLQVPPSGVGTWLSEMGISLITLAKAACK